MIGGLGPELRRGDRMARAPTASHQPPISEVGYQKLLILHHFQGHRHMS
jgi:hypothetical protein